MDIAMNLSTCATATAAMILSLQLKNHFDSLALLHPVGNGPFRSTQVHSSKKNEPSTILQKQRRFSHQSATSRTRFSIFYNTLQTTTKAAAAI
jgi:hypothetical protein